MVGWLNGYMVRWFLLYLMILHLGVKVSDTFND